MPNLRFPFAAIVLSTSACLTGCAPLCAAVDAWTWGTCFADIHGRDPAAARSELDEAPAAAYDAAIGPGRALVRNYLVAQNIPGLSVAVSSAGQLVWAEGFGWADVDLQRPVTPRTRFRIGGVAETLTAAAVGLLMERDALDIDRPVRDYVPSYPEPPWPITTRQLMSHTAGLRHYDDDEMLYREQSCAGPLDALSLYADAALRFEPGTAARYSGYDFTLVGAVVQAAAGETFMSFMQREVFDALGMAETSIDAPGRYPSETTRFYWPFAARNTTTGIEYANDPDNSCLQGAAGLLSTPTDLVRFGRALLAGELLREATLNMLLTPVELASGEATENGLGWRVRTISRWPTVAPTPAYGRHGLSAGGTAVLLAVPEHELVLAIVANVSYARELDSLSEGLAGIFFVDRP